MDELTTLLHDTASRLFKDASETMPEISGTLDPQLWQSVQELGFDQILVPEEMGGAGGTWNHAKVLLQAMGYHPAALPLAEVMLANKLLAERGHAPDPEILTLAVPNRGLIHMDGGRKTVNGSVSVLWGRLADALVTTAENKNESVLVRMATSEAQIIHGHNLAGEAIDRLQFDHSTAEILPIEKTTAAPLYDYATLLRLAQILGALERALEMSVDYANERKQFGRVIGKFQAVQQSLALFGSEVAAANCAIRAAFDAADAGGDPGFQIANAKLRSNMAIATATATAHQVHAAIGFTWEFPLRLLTQRLSTWRSEYGNERVWSERIGKQVIERGADNFWSDLTSLDDAIKCNHSGG